MLIIHALLIVVWCVERLVEREREREMLMARNLAIYSTWNNLQLALRNIAI